MYNKTLLNVVQDSLESMDSDNVSSIYDTEEAEQIANIAKQTYEYMHSVYDWPYQKKLYSLQGLNDTDFPTYLRIPQEVSEVLWVKYRGEPIGYISPEKFIEVSDSRRQAYDNGDTRIEKVDSLEGISLYIRNDRDPDCYTSFDNKHLITLSYDSTKDTTLHENNTSAHCVITPSLVIADNTVPFLPDNMFPHFQAEVNKAAHLYLRQQASPVDMERSLVGRSKMKKKSDRINQQKVKGFGRK